MLKKIKLFSVFAILSLLFVNFSGALETLQVTVSMQGKKSSYLLRQKMKKKAKQEAIKKYILRVNKNVPFDKIRQAYNEPDKFVKKIYPENTQWQPLNNEGFGQLTSTYTVKLKDDLINRYLEQIGVKLQGNTNLIILEEPPSQADINFGEKLGKTKFFIKNYTKFQRILRDTIIKNIDKYGFSVVLLADRPSYKSFKTKDSTLLGVFFDPNYNKFVVHKDLLEQIESDFPDTIILYYRIDNLIYNLKDAKLTARISLNFKNLKTNTTKSIGSQQYSVPVSSSQPDVIVNAFETCVENAVQLLMNEAGPKLNGIIMSLNNAPVVAGPIQINLNGKLLDKKIRKRLLYYLKKQLIKSKLIETIKLRNTSLLFTLKPEYKNAEDVWYEKILPILESKKLKLTVTDDDMEISGNQITGKLSAKDDDDDDD